MKTLILFRSKSGFTKSYIDYIREEMDCDIIENKDIDLNQIKNYDTIIYGGGLYISGINGIEIITKNYDELISKNLIVFFVGASPGRDCEIEEVITKNFTDQQQRHIKFFYFRGGFDFKRLKFIDKILMTLLKLKLKIKKSKNNDEVGMLKAYSKPIDYTSKHRVLPLVEYVNNLDNNK